MTRLNILAPIAVVLLLAGTARAQAPGSSPNAPAPEQQFGRAGRISLTAERLFGLTYVTLTPGSSSITTISFFGSSGFEAGVAFYSIPRLGFDYFVADGLSLGLGAQIANASPSGGDDSLTVVGLNPRFGYAARLSEAVSLWPRAGVSYFHFSTGSSYYFLAISLEAQLVVTPLPHFGFTIGPVVDVGIAGTNNRKATQFGLQAGLLGWF